MWVLSPEIPYCGPQTSNTILMISPAAFGHNEETATDNSFMATEVVSPQVLSAICDSHSHWVSELRKLGVSINLFTHEISHGTPDATFPNNWFSARRSWGKDPFLILYPMKHPSRQKERRPDILESLRQSYPGPPIDLSHWEKEGKALEGTGSIVADWVHGCAYVSLSPRADLDVANDFIKQISGREGRPWKLIAFKSIRNNQEVYHTNVMMAIGTDWAVCCLDIIEGEESKTLVRTNLTQCGKQLVEITAEQVDKFCGNVIEVKTESEQRLFICSDTAFNAFKPEQLKVFEQSCKVVHFPLSDLERVGGGGIRCCIAELH